MKLGTLLVVSTPIGDSGDITLRAIEALRNCDLLFCEDLREARRLLYRLTIEKELHPLNEHTTREATTEALDALREGKTLALISDCGTPLIADPGSELVQRAIDEGHRITPLPGASSLLAALVVSGFDTRTFTFAGFLPREKSKRMRAAHALVHRTETLLFLEAPYRLNQLLADITAAFGASRRAALAIDLTLPKERVRRDTLLGLKDYFLEHPFKGEFVLVVEGATPQHRGARTHPHPPARKR